MNRKTLIVLSVTGAISMAAALSTMSVAMARSGKTADHLVINTTVAASPDDQEAPRGRKPASLVSGTVKSLTSSQIIVTDSANADVNIAINSDTQFMIKGVADKTVAQLLVGQKVTVIQDGEGGAAKIVIAGEMPKPQMRPAPGGPGGKPRMGPGGPGGRPDMHRRGPGGRLGPGGPPAGRFVPGAPVKPANAGFGTVAQISDSSVTLTLARPAGDKTTETYVINSDTKVMPMGGQSKVAVGDTVLVVCDENKVAKSIMRAPGLRKPGTGAQPKTTST